MIANHIIPLILLGTTQPALIAQTQAAPVAKTTTAAAPQTETAAPDANADADADASTEAPSDDETADSDARLDEAAQNEGAQGETAEAPVKVEAPKDDTIKDEPPAPVAAEAATSSKNEAAPAEAVEEEAPKPGPTQYKAGKGFQFQSADEQFSMDVRVRVQFLNETLITDTLNDAGESESAVLNTFGIRRARLQFSGHMFGEDNSYKAEFAFSPRDLGLKPGGSVTNSPLLSWYTEHTQIRDLSLRVGQYKLLYSRQRVISSGNQEFVDRSEAQGEFNLDRDIGGHLFSEDIAGLGLFRYYAGASIGEGRDVWETENLSDADDASYQLLGRVEILPFGMFKDYSEGDFERGDDVRVSLGGAYAYLHHGREVRGYQGGDWADGGTVDYHNVNADALLFWKGLSTFGEFYWRDGDRQIGGITVDEDGAALDPDSLKARNGLGASIQAGYVLPGSRFNVGARYSTVWAGGYADTSTTIDSNSELGATVGFFPGGHPFKIQADYFHLWGDDYLEGNAERIRVQMQVSY